MGKYDYGAAGSAALSGAGTGGAIGSVVPVVGTAAGAAIGGLAGFTAGLFGSKKKKKKKLKRISSLDEAQQKLNEQQHQSILGEGPLADLYNYNPEQANAVFDKTIGNPAYRNFQENIVPTVTGAFRNQGLQNSSYVGGALAKEGRNVQESLDAQRAQYLYGKEQAAQTAKQNAVENLQNRKTFAYEQPVQNASSDLNNILSSITPEAIQQFTGYFSGGGGPKSSIKASNSAIAGGLYA